MLYGKARITSVDQDGRNFIEDVKEGDLWYFPSGLPHSIQALEDGCEFLLVFDDGSFSENSTFQVTDWLAHTPDEVIAANFGISKDVVASLPVEEKIFSKKRSLAVLRKTKLKARTERYLYLSATICLNRNRLYPAEGKYGLPIPPTSKHRKRSLLR